jgi:hypothetical protein
MRGTLKAWKIVVGRSMTAKQTARMDALSTKTARHKITVMTAMKATGFKYELLDPDANEIAT